MNYYIITGTSRGLGESLVKQLISPNTKVFCLSRTKNVDLLEELNISSSGLYFYQVNLEDSINIESVLNEIFQEIQDAQIESITLINNAGVIEPITNAGTMTSSDLKASVEINLLAPMILSNLFLQFTTSIKAKKTIVNISSGAAHNPYSGWSSYCATKSGLDMFTRTAGLEQQKEKFPTTVISFSPGIMDTSMQTTIRSKTKQQFDSIDKFIDYKEKGLLRSTDFVAAVLLKLLEEDALTNGKVYDIKQLI